MAQSKTIAQKIFVIIFLTIFLGMFTSGGVAFAVLSRRDNVPFIFTLMGWGFAAIGIIIYISSIYELFSTGHTTTQPNSTSTPSSQGLSGIPCTGCGARRTESSACAYCGAP